MTADIERRVAEAIRSEIERNNWTAGVPSPWLWRPDAPFAVIARAAIAAMQKPAWISEKEALPPVGKVAD